MLSSEVTPLYGYASGRVCLDVGQALLGLLLLNHMLVGRVEDVVDGAQDGSARVGLATPQ